jgi:Ca2+-binding RTX toxin-like protein
MFESLENRCFLSSSLTVNGSTLSVTGNGDDDTITVRETGGSVHVEYTDANGAPQVADVAGITAITINGGGGSDQIFYTGDSIGASIRGDGDNVGGDSHSHGNGPQNGKGHEKAKGKGHNKGGSDGGAGGDNITVTDDGAGSSTVHGDAGDDNITLLHGNNTQIFGDDGNDFIFINTDNTGGSANVDAGNGNDTISTTSGTNTINGGAGNDTLIELGGTNTTSNVETTL